MTTASLKRRNEAVKLRADGLTFEEIGKHFGVTRERARQIVKGNPRPQKPNPDSKVMLTGQDVALLLNIHINTVRRWSNDGSLKSYRIGSRGDRRFLREDVESLLSGVMREVRR